MPRNPKSLANLKRKGRPRGVLNKATRAIKEASQALLSDEQYQANLRKRLREGKAPHMEVLLHHYAHGKPKETIEHQVPMRPVVVDLLTPGEGLKVDGE